MLGKSKQQIERGGKPMKTHDASVIKSRNFTGKETEKEFLETCLSQYEWTQQTGNCFVGKMAQISLVFKRIEHRLVELERD